MKSFREKRERWHRLHQRMHNRRDRWMKQGPEFWGIRHPFRRIKFQFQLQRRIFFWFGATIVLSALAAGFCFHFLGGGEKKWESDLRYARTFLANRYAEVWHDPQQLARLAKATAEELHVGLRLRNAEGGVLQSMGGSCKKPFEVPIRAADGTALGDLTLCFERHTSGQTFLFSFIGGLLVIWAASGIIARRIARPLYRIALAADDIGRGQLSSRVRLPIHQGGEMGLLAEAIYDMAVRIEKQLADQRALLATVSHEIRTPLARMRLLIEFARGEANETARLDELDREIVAIDALVSDLLAGSRIDFAAIKPVDLDATEIAKEAVERTGVAPEKLVVDTPHLGFSGDPTLVARAVTNLLENADRHAGGVTMFHVHQDGDFVAFDVEDDGPGFGPGEESQAFEPFYKNPRSPAASARSSGLGLALVKRIAEAHGGRAFAENRAQGGARVGVRFKWVGR